MAQQVLCEVNNCHYWKQGNKCTADQIFVITHKRNAEELRDTDCSTFTPEKDVQ
ncbi:DUF1540 domain-containing protein [Bacillus lacus]|uniref:DUF1540 domain-containing protein n=1 Tax=Metabacillus lacus TaxID=1983721 RepID=A0A7X2J2J4_9BACI|nr:DUF1540 domain-containing protein [Metabacillus lacus]MRX74282.1 DUF1540 domain-containing protein [Metabacillus lacus]